MEYVHPEIFEARINCKIKGFKMVSASPFARSSFHADEDLSNLNALNLMSQKNSRTVQYYR